VIEHGRRIISGSSAVALAIIAIAAAFAAVALAVTPKTGTYKGSVATFKISFKVSKDRSQVIDLQSNWEPTGCPGLSPAQPAPTVHYPDAKIKHGSFKSEKFRAVITGKFGSATKAKGTVHVHFKLGGSGPLCNETAKFAVKRQ
jgi:hypothetical protein